MMTKASWRTTTTGILAIVVALSGALKAELDGDVSTAADWGAVAGGYLAFLLLSGALLSMGMLCSAFTNNQIVALILSFSAGLALYVLAWLGDGPDAWQTQLSIGSHLEDFLRGAVRLSDVVYYLSFIAFFLFATHQRLESTRWR